MANENTATQKTITLRSNDGEQFSVSETAAVLSVTISNMVDDGCADDVIPLQNIDGRTLAKVITYLNKHATENGASDEEKKKFDEEYLSGKDTQGLFPLLLAANYLNVRCLLDILAQKIADSIANKSVEGVRKTFNIENDFTPEEEEAVRREHDWAHEGVDAADDD